MRCVRPAGVLINFRIMKTTTNRLTTLLFFLFLSHTAAFAGSTDDLYAGEVEVRDESVDARNEALGRILGQVMVRLSGRSDILANPAAASLLGEAPTLVQQFRYRSVPAPADELAPPARYLWARFDPVALQRLMREKGLPVWTGRRPRVLMWTAVEVGVNRQLLNVADDEKARAALLARARARGMPLQLPLLDLQDQSAVTAADIWADYEEAIRKASGRYPHEAILTGRLSQQVDGRWTGDWTLWSDGRREDLHSQGGTLADALAAAVDAAQDHLAIRFNAPLAEAGESVRVSIEGIHSLADYSHLLVLLGNTPGLGPVRIQEADRDRLLLVFAGSRDADAVGAALAALPGLEPLPGVCRPVGDGGRGSQAADLYFGLVRRDSDPDSP